MRRFVGRCLRVVPIFLLAAAASLGAQGATTGSLTGRVTSAGAPVARATVVAVHVESGTRYNATTREDGRYFIPAMRVGGPYTVAVTRIGLQRTERTGVTITLSQGTEVDFDVQAAAVQLSAVTVQGQQDPTLSPDRTGAATTVPRDAIAAMPTISNRLESLVRLTPQSGGTGSTSSYTFVGQDPRYNNITVDGSYFNNSFGLGNVPGDRTSVAPISLSAVEQVQVNVAPFDVREGHFIGAAVNTVTRSGTNTVRGSFFYQGRNQNYIGKQAGNSPYNPGTSKYHNGGGWISGPIVKDKLFYFFNYENENTSVPGTTYLANTGGQTVGGNTTRVLASDLDSLSRYLAKNFNYTTGPYQGYNNNTPATRYLGKIDYNVSENHKLSLRYTQLSSSTDVLLSNSSALGFGNRRTSTQGLNYQASNYSILENIKSFIGELNSSFGGGVSNQLIAGYTTNDESRGALNKLFPFVDILSGTSVYTSFGSEPFTPNNVLKYHTFQAQDNFTIYRDRHTFTFGASGEKYHSLNIFYPGSQSAYVYNSLQDFFTDANGYLANPNRTTSPVSLRTFQVRYMNIPGLDKPVQPLDVWYGGIYAQDKWTPTRDLEVTLGLRIDATKFQNTAYDNPNADKLTFRDEKGNPVQYNSGALPKATPLLSPRIGINWDVTGDRSTQIRGGTGVFTGPPAYVWISNQIGNTGMLTGFDQLTNTTARPWNPNPNQYKPATVTGAPAASYELDVTDPNFKFPQTWRSDVAIDKRLPWGFVGTAEFIYNRDINDVYYINANLPAPQSQYTGVDQRPRWTGTSCNTPSTATPACVTRINNAPGNQVTSAYVLKSRSGAYSWNSAFSLERTFANGFYLKGAYSYTLAKSYFDPSSTASSNWTGNPTPGDPNNPGLGYSFYWPGGRYYIAATLRRNPFKIGTTTISVFTEWRQQGGGYSYVFSGDANGDGGTGNDLIYIPRDTSEMYFRQYSSTITVNGQAQTATFTPQQQQQAWEKFIQQDDYLASHRGKYAQRNGALMPFLMQTDLSFSQELARNFAGHQNGLEARIDILNVGNLLNHNWGIGDRIVTTSPLTSPSADTQGRLTYTLRNINNQLVSHTFEKSVSLGDVYRFQLSLRYNFY